MLPHFWFEFAKLYPLLRTVEGEIFPLIVSKDTAASDPFSDKVFHSMDYYSLALTLRGNAHIFVNGSYCRTRRGDIFTIDPGAEYAARSCENYVCYSAVFTRDIFDAAQFNAIGGLPGLHFLAEGGHGASPGARLFNLRPTAYKSVEKLFEAMYREYCSGSAEGLVMARLLFLQMLVTLSRLYSDPVPGAEGAGQESPSIVAALDHFETNFANDIRIEAVAASCFLSPDAFGREFKACVGQTPRDYLKSLRIEHAKDLLISTSDPVAEVGWRCGFRNCTYFIRSFRGATGVTPRAFRSGRHAGRG